MNQRAIRAIVTKDLKVVRQTKGVIIPLILVPVLILAIFPGILGILLSGVEPNSPAIEDFRSDAGAFFDNMPELFSDKLNQYDNDVQRITYLVFNLFFPAMYLLLPTMVSNIIAADSFAGEKERKTLEALAHSPTTDRELYLAKVLGPWLAGIAVGWIGYLVFVLVVTLTTASLMNGVFVVDVTWLLFILWLTPAASGIGLGAMVLVSSRVSTFQEAYQLGGVVVIPALLLLFGQLGGVIYLSPAVILIVGVVMWGIALALVGFGARTFRRSALITRL